MSIWNWWAFSAFCAFSALTLFASPVYAVIVFSGSGYGAGVGAFVHTGAVRRARLNAAGIRKRKNRAKRRIRREIITYLIRHLRIERIFLSGVVSSDDAMHTALLFALLNTVSRIRPLRIRNDTRADFVLGFMDMEFTGILSVPAGHIMIAALKYAAILAREKINLWTNIRSKA